jgi:hypothetical protein
VSITMQGVGVDVRPVEWQHWSFSATPNRAPGTCCENQPLSVP